MRIGLENGGTTYWLAGESGVAESVHSSVRDYTLNGDRQLEVANVVRANFTRQFDRGQQANVVEFGTTRTFTTADLCFLYTLDYLGNIPLTGTLLFEVDIPGGGTSLRVMANAVMQRPQFKATGVSLTLDFVVTGGAITTVANIGHYLTGSGGDYLNGAGDLYLTGS